MQMCPSIYHHIFIDIWIIRGVTSSRACVLSALAKDIMFDALIHIFAIANVLTFETSNLICIYIVSLHIHLDSKTQRTHGRQAQIGNIAAARAVADIIRSTLGPRSMLKVRR